MDFVSWLATAPAVRRLVWRAGRRLCCAARGEAIGNSIAINGEAYVQRCAVRALGAQGKRVAFDVAAPYVTARIWPDRVELPPNWHLELERLFEANYLIVRRMALAWLDGYAGDFDVSNTYA